MNFDIFFILYFPGNVIFRNCVIVLCANVYQCECMSGIWSHVCDGDLSNLTITGEKVDIPNKEIVYQMRLV